MTAPERDLGDWTDREMWDGIWEAVVRDSQITESGPPDRRVHRGACHLCDWKTNPRGTTTGVVNDFVQHAVAGHAALVRKHIRQIQRRAHLAGATNEKPQR